MNKSYAIELKGTEKDTIRVLTILFLHGYVLDGERRIKSWDEYTVLLNEYIPDYPAWKYVVTNKYKTCKAVVSVWTTPPDDSEIISLEKFLKLNH